MSLQSRPAGPEDEPFLYRLAFDRFREELPVDLLPPAIRESLLKLQIEGQRTSYSTAFPSADHLILLSAGQPVGRLLIDRGPDGFHIVDILLAKEHRSRGIGGTVLRDLCREADAARKPIRLTVRVGNRAANLYGKLGFHVMGTQDDRLLMERPPQPVPHS